MRKETCAGCNQQRYKYVRTHTRSAHSPPAHIKPSHKKCRHVILTGKHGNLLEVCLQCSNVLAVVTVQETKISIKTSGNPEYMNLKKIIMYIA